MWNHQPLNFSVDTSAGFSSGKASGKNATMIVCFTAKLQIGQTVPSPWSPYLGLSKNRGTVDHKMARFNENHPLNLIQFESVSININVVSVVSIYIYFPMCGWFSMFLWSETRRGTVSTMYSSSAASPSASPGAMEGFLFPTGKHSCFV